MITLLTDLPGLRLRALCVARRMLVARATVASETSDDYGSAGRAHIVAPRHSRQGQCVLGLPICCLRAECRRVYGLDQSLLNIEAGMLPDA